MKTVTIFVATIILASCVLIFPELSIQAMVDSLGTCVHSVVPALFPYLVVTNLWLTMGITTSLSRYFGRFVRTVFHLPAQASPALLLGSISGFPIGAHTVSKLYRNKLLTKSEAEQTLFFCSNAGPAFVISYLGGVVLNSHKLGFMLWSIHLIGAIILGVLFRPIGLPQNEEDHEQTITPPVFLSSLSSSILSAGKSVFGICIYICFFGILTKLIMTLIPLENMNTLSTILFGFLEITAGTERLDTFSNQTAFVLSSALLAWNGLCVHCQAISSADNTDLSFKRYFIGKIMHIFISITFACVASAFVFPPHKGSLLLLLLPLLCVILITASSMTAKTSSGKII